MPVMESGRLVGLVTAENVGEFFMIRAALANRPPRATPPPLPPGMVDASGHWPASHPSTARAAQIV
jgi:hypothetical protein